MAAELCAVCAQGPGSARTGRHDHMVATALAPIEPPEVTITVVKGDSQLAVPFGRARRDPDEWTWGHGSILEPPLDVDLLLLLYANSDTLQQCVDSMVANIDARGWIPEAVLDLEADDAAEQVSSAIYLERRSRFGAGAELPTQEEIDETLTEWRREARLEKAFLKLKIDSLCFEPGGFTGLRKRRRVDGEVIGWGTWELLRDDQDMIVRGKHIPARSVRLTPVDSEATPVVTWVPTSAVSRQKVTVYHKFRRIVQQTADGEIIVFKEFGDPRTIDSATGAEYDPTDETNSHRVPATEILWFGGYYPEGAYPQPRWHGLTPNIIGSREASEDNARYLTNSAIPTGLLLIGDGRAGASSKQSLTDFFDTSQGQARHKVALVEAQTPRENFMLSGSGRVTLQWVSLRQAQQDDLTFAKYIEQVANQVGESFRLPALLRGKVEGLNRATAQAALEFAEDQVFAPEREEFDELINNTLLVNWGIRFWRFRSLGSRKRDPDVVAKIAKNFVDAGVATPAELRPLAERLLGIELPSESSDWQQIPVQFTLAGIMPPGAKPPVTVAPSAEGAEDGDITAPQQAAPSSVEDIAKHVLRWEAILKAAQAARYMQQMQEYDGDGDTA